MNTKTSKSTVPNCPESVNQALILWVLSLRFTANVKEGTPESAGQWLRPLAVLCATSGRPPSQLWVQQLHFIHLLQAQPWFRQPQAASHTPQVNAPLHVLPRGALAQGIGTAPRSNPQLSLRPDFFIHSWHSQEIRFFFGRPLVFTFSTFIIFPRL